MLHLADLQPEDPNIALQFDADPVAAARTRLAGLEQAARNGWIVAGSHISGFNRVVSEGTGHRLCEV